MSIFTIKLIAVITMLLDHIRYAIPETNCILFELLGRMSYPLFAFVLTEGYIHTSSKKEYAKRLIKYGLISQIPFMLFRSMLGKNEWKMLNIMFTLLLGFFGILSLDKIKNKYSRNFNKEMPQYVVVQYLINTDETLKNTYNLYQGIIKSITKRDF